MNKTETLHTALLCLGAAALAGALAFLYHKTEAIELRQQNEILGLLRELKDIDSRWDLDVVRARSELPAVELPVPNRAAAARKALESLAAAVQRTPSATLSDALPELNAALQQKSALIEKFGVENSAARHGHVEHFLQAKRLGAELDVIVHPLPPAAELELDGKKGPVRVLLDDVAFAVHPEPVRPDGQSPQ